MKFVIQLAVNVLLLVVLFFVLDQRMDDKIQAKEQADVAEMLLPVNEMRRVTGHEAAQADSYAELFYAWIGIFSSVIDYIQVREE